MARAIGVRKGWNAVTIRAVASKLGYTSPLLYEYFKDNQALLTQIAVAGLHQLESMLSADLPKASDHAVETMVYRYWTFMLKNTQLYRLINGMDGTPVDRESVGMSAQSLCTFIATVIRPLAGQNATEGDAMIHTEELWALLHGMCALHLDRSVPSIWRGLPLRRCGS